jgi:L-ribulokinase
VNDISPQKMSFGELGAKAALLEPGESGLLALDWLNGNRSLFLDQRLTGLVLGLTLHTKPEEIYRALVEATGFGGKMIIEQIMGHGVPVNSIVVCGGIPHKDPVLMQIYADIFDMTISVASSKETCALGGAVVAAVNAGVWENFDDAIEHMTHVNACRYVPEKDKVAVYDRLFALYKGLSFSFGKKNYQSSLFSVMKDLIAIREGVLKMKQR